MLAENYRVIVSPGDRTPPRTTQGRCANSAAALQVHAPLFFDQACPDKWQTKTSTAEKRLRRRASHQHFPRAVCTAARNLAQRDHAQLRRWYFARVRPRSAE